MSKTAEFEEEAGALVQRVAELHGDDRIAAAARGSASPAGLRWLAETLALTPQSFAADLGAGLGGPAAWLRAHAGSAVVAADPSAAATRGGRELFGLPAVRAIADAAPFASGRFDAVLVLGVLSVVDDRLAVLAEAHRLGPQIGVLDYCSTSGRPVTVGGSTFPTAAHLAGELGRWWPDVVDRRVDEPTPASWQRAAEWAHRGIARPASEVEVIDAIDAGTLTLHALVGR